MAYSQRLADIRIRYFLVSKCGFNEKANTTLFGK